MFGMQGRPGEVLVLFWIHCSLRALFDFVALVVQVPAEMVPAKIGQPLSNTFLSKGCSGSQGGE